MTAEQEIITLIEKSIPKEYIPRFKYYPILENRIPKKSLEKIKNAVSALFYIEKSSPEELESEIDILIDIISNENLSVVTELAGWFNNYLAGLSENIDKKGIEQTARNLLKASVPFDIITKSTGLTEEEIKDLS